MAAPLFRPRARRASIAALVVALVATASDALAYCLSTTCSGDCPRDENGCKTTGVPLRWPSRCVGFSLQKDGTANLPMEEVRPVIEAAFLAWTELACDDGVASIAFSELADVSCHQAEYDQSAPNANIVLFQDTSWEYKGADNNLAKTTVTFDKQSGAILDADIEINFAFNELTTGDDHIVYDLASIVTHEVGHFIGLDHSPEGDATMFEAYDEGSLTQRTLEADDVAGACAVYPPESDAACAPEPNNGLGDTCSSEPLEDPTPGGCAVATRDVRLSLAREGFEGGTAATVALFFAGAAGAVRRARRTRRTQRERTSELAK